MSQNTTIEWTDSTWNPIRGCSRVSPGCKHCYAERTAARFAAPGKPFEGFVQWRSEASGLLYDSREAAGDAEPRWSGRVELVDSHLVDPLRWRDPRRVFVNSMSDLFHEALDFRIIAAVFGVMALACQHTFQVLTKRPARMLEFFDWVSKQDDPEFFCRGGAWTLAPDRDQTTVERREGPARGWPLPNVWLGVSVENQAAADERIPLLLQVPAAVRFISAEPLLGPVVLQERVGDGDPRVDPLAGLRGYLRAGRHDSPPSERRRVNWVIVGGESGPGARPFDLAWARLIVQQCKAAGVACFVKQLGARPVTTWSNGDLCDALHPRDKKGGDPAEWPEDLRVRQFPESR